MTIFEPTDDYKKKYPELSRVQEFKELNDNDLSFAWYMGNQTSPFYKMDNEKKLKESAKKVFGSGEKSDKYAKGEYDYKVSNAILKMATFIPSLREKANASASNIFDRIVEISNLQPHHFKNGDTIDYKKQLDVYAEALNQLPKALKIAEEGFGVKDGNSKTFNQNNVAKGIFQSNNKEK